MDNLHCILGDSKNLSHFCYENRQAIAVFSDSVLKEAITVFNLTLYFKKSDVNISWLEGTC